MNQRERWKDKKKPPALYFFFFFFKLRPTHCLSQMINEQTQPCRGCKTKYNTACKVLFRFMNQVNELWGTMAYNVIIWSNPYLHQIGNDILEKSSKLQGCRRQRTNADLYKVFYYNTFIKLVVKWNAQASGINSRVPLCPLLTPHEKMSWM